LCIDRPAPGSLRARGAFRVLGSALTAKGPLRPRDEPALPQTPGQLELLRDAPEPLTASEITSRLLAAKGVSEAPREDFRNLFGGVQASLRNNDGKTVRAVGEGKPVKWSIEG
jgi:hypothetical protein